MEAELKKKKTKGKNKKKFVSVDYYITKKKKKVLVTTFTISTHGSSPLASKMFSSTLMDPKALD